MSRKAMGKGSVLALSVAVLALLAAAASAGMNEDLKRAAERGNLPEVKRLLAAGAEVNAKDLEGQTALIWASKQGHLEVVRTLLATRADVNPKGKDGWTALMGATKNGHRDVAELLRQAGAK